MKEMISILCIWQKQTENTHTEHGLKDMLPHSALQSLFQFDYKVKISICKFHFLF